MVRNDVFHRKQKHIARTFPRQLPRMPVSSLRVAGGGSHGPRIKKYAENVWRADVEHDRRVHIAYERQQEQIELEKRQASALNNDTSNGSLSNGSFMSNGTRRNDSTVAIGHVDSIPNGGKDSVAKIVEHPVLSNFGRGHDWDDNPYGDWTTVTWTTTPHRTRKLLEDFEEVRTNSSPRHTLVDCSIFQEED